MAGSDEARSLLKGLLKAKPPADTAAAASYYLGLAHQKAGDAQEASAAFSDVLKKHGDSPHAAYAALELAALHAADRKNDDQMTAWFETAVQTATTPSAKAEALFRWGDWAYRQGRYQLAADTLQSLLVELPGERRAATPGWPPPGACTIWTAPPKRWRPRSDWPRMRPIPKRRPREPICAPTACAR
jgi:TolA-binding protein